MDEDKIDLKPDVNETDVDRAVVASHLILSAILTIGPLIGEAVKHAIPNQRIDHIARMLQILEGKAAVLRVRPALEDIAVASLDRGFKGRESLARAGDLRLGTEHTRRFLVPKRSRLLAFDG
jgi:hypothetical protein